MPAIKTGMTNVAGHFCSHIGKVSQVSTGGHVAGASAAYENQALQSSCRVRFHFVKFEAFEVCFNLLHL